MPPGGGLEASSAKPAWVILTRVPSPSGASSIFTTVSAPFVPGSPVTQVISISSSGTSSRNLP